MNQNTILKGEQICKELGYTGVEFSNFMHGYSEGYNNFRKTIQAPSYEEGYRYGKNAFTKLESSRTKRKFNLFDKKTRSDSI